MIRRCSVQGCIPGCMQDIRCVEDVQRTIHLWKWMTEPCSTCPQPIANHKGLLRPLQGTTCISISAQDYYSIVVVSSNLGWLEGIVEIKVYILLAENCGIRQNISVEALRSGATGNCQFTTLEQATHLKKNSKQIQQLVIWSKARYSIVFHSNPRILEYLKQNLVQYL